MASTFQPKGRFHVHLDERDFPGLTVSLEKTNPAAEVIIVQIQRIEGDGWKANGRLAIYMSLVGTY